ncbi:hypothetical protein [Cytobacillus firmus]|uniref:hypothetical protein n=1 Tax=Cytobacillus firmus TaxID=1399 RepID=UPI002228194A|nr:hypothetical protein [Cytobacillus firmus]
MLEYLLSQKQDQSLLPENAAVIKIIVTFEIGRKIAEYDIQTLDTLTGFKFSGEKYNGFEKTGQHPSYLDMKKVMAI